MPRYSKPCIQSGGAAQDTFDLHGEGVATPPPLDPPPFSSLTQVAWKSYIIAGND